MKTRSRRLAWPAAALASLACIVMLVDPVLSADTPTPYPKVAAHWGRAWGPDLRYQQDELEELDYVGFIANAYTPAEVAPLKARNPNRIFAYNMTVGGVPWLDYDRGEEMLAYQWADTTWSPVRAFQARFIEALKAGVDWTDRDAYGHARSLWGMRKVRWDSGCPRYRGRTAAETYTELVIGIATRGGWSWNALFVDTCPDATPAEIETSARMLDRWISALPPEMPITVGQSKLPESIRRQLSGRKGEHFWWQWGVDGRLDWFAWWYGSFGEPLGTIGYWETEQSCKRPGASDHLTGWDVTVLDGMIPPWGWSDARIRQYWRFVLATALLGEGYASFEREQSPQRWCLAPEIYEWRFERAMTRAFFIPDSRDPTREVAARVFRWPGPQERYVTVVVNPHTQEGYLVNGWYGPGRRLDPTPDGRRKY